MDDNPVYAYSPIVRRPVLRLPEGKRLAVWFGVNVEHYKFGVRSISLAEYTAHLNPDPLNHGWRDYGLRVGLWRLAEIFERFGLPMTAILNSDVVHHCPELIEEGRARGWRWIGHGENNSTYLVGIERDAERAAIQRVTDTIAEATGVVPRGWLGPALTESGYTNDLLAELGYTYTLNWSADDEPFRLRNGLISVPYAIEVNDIPAFALQGLSGPQFRDLLIDQFDQLLAEGADRPRVMGVGLHPFLVGQPYRAKHFIAALEYLTQHRDDVWFTSGDEIAAWYAEANPA